MTTARRDGVHATHPKGSKETADERKARRLRDAMVDALQPDATEEERLLRNVVVHGVHPKGIKRNKTEEEKKTDADIGQRIALIRLREELDLRTFAREVGVTAQAVHSWETGEAGITHYNLTRICDVYAISMDWLVRNIGRPRDTYENRMRLLSEKEKEAFDGMFVNFLSALNKPPTGDNN